MDTVKIASEIFHNIAVGIASLIGVLAGTKLSFSYFKKKFKIKKYRNLYPEYDFGQDRKYSIVRPVGVDALFLIEWKKPNNVLHHIKNPETLHDLGYNSYDWVSLSKNEYKDANKGDVIDTTK